MDRDTIDACIGSKQCDMNRWLITRIMALLAILLERELITKELWATAVGCLETKYDQLLAEAKEVLANGR